MLMATLTPLAAMTTRLTRRPEACSWALCATWRQWLLLGDRSKTLGSLSSSCGGSGSGADIGVLDLLASIGFVVEYDVAAAAPHMCANCG